MSVVVRDVRRRMAEEASLLAVADLQNPLFTEEIDERRSWRYLSWLALQGRRSPLFFSVLLDGHATKYAPVKVDVEGLILRLRRRMVEKGEEPMANRVLVEE